MDDAARIGIVLLWCLVALLAASKARRSGPSAWWGCALLALALASLKLWAWNKPLYQMGRGWLREAGVYGDRVTYKIALGVTLIVSLAVLAWRTRRRVLAWPGDLQLALCPMVVQAVYVSLLTFSLYFWLPRAITEQPGRSILNYSLGGLALIGAAWRGVPADGREVR